MIAVTGSTSDKQSICIKNDIKIICGDTDFF